jgi:hypothetical protein
MSPGSPVRGHRSVRWLGATVGVLLAVVLLSAPAAAVAANYSFTRVADSVADGFDPSSFGSAAINAPGDVAFRAGRSPQTASRPTPASTARTPAEA